MKADWFVSRGAGLGLAGPLRRLGFVPDRQWTQHWQTGEVLREAFRGADFAEKHGGAGYYHIHRADLHAMLVDALEAAAPGALRLGQALGDVSPDGAMVFADGAVIGPEHLAFDTLAPPVAPDAALPLPGSVRHHEDRVIRRALAETHDRRSAAQRLGISERTLRYKLAAMAVRPPRAAAMVQ